MAVFPRILETSGPFHDVQYHGVFRGIKGGVVKLASDVLRKQVAVGDAPSAKVRDGISETDGLDHGVVATKLAVWFLEVTEHSIGAVQTAIAVAFVSKTQCHGRVVAWRITPARECPMGLVVPHDGGRDVGAVLRLSLIHI